MDTAAYSQWDCGIINWGCWAEGNGEEKAKGKRMFGKYMTLPIL